MGIFQDFSPGLFFMQLVILIVLVLLLAKFAWKPIMDSILEREDGIKNALESAEEAKKEMQNLKADNDRLLKEARAERDEMMKEAREIKDKMISDAKEEAQVQANTMIENAKATIKQEQAAAVAEIKKTVGDLSINIAEKVIKQGLSKDQDQISLVESMVKDITLN